MLVDGIDLAKGQLLTGYVAFLRAVNVGGTGKVAMAELKALAEKIGLGRPRTLLQSGNLVFDAKSTSTAALEKLLEREVAGRFGVKPDVMVRSAKELAAIIAAQSVSRRKPGAIRAACTSIS